MRVPGKAQEKVAKISFVVDAAIAFHNPAQTGKVRIDLDDDFEAAALVATVVKHGSPQLSCRFPATINALADPVLFKLYTTNGKSRYRVSTFMVEYRKDVIQVNHHHQS
jgi:hypothetical protein